jgi:uncharacterized protein YqgV (UPF0045/DUF77 family)
MNVRIRKAKEVNAIRPTKMAMKSDPFSTILEGEFGSLPEEKGAVIESVARPAASAVFNVARAIRLDRGFDRSVAMCETQCAAGDVPSPEEVAWTPMEGPHPDPRVDDSPA